jgi:hypothetical protein
LAIYKGNPEYTERIAGTEVYKNEKHVPEINISFLSLLQVA